MDWSDRSARISRLKEKLIFDQVVMPLTYTGAGIGLLILFWQGLEILEGNPANRVWWVPASFFFLLPLPLAVYRWLRKHNHRRLQA